MPKYGMVFFSAQSYIRINHTSDVVLEKESLMRFLFLSYFSVRRMLGLFIRDASNKYNVRFVFAFVETSRKSALK